MRQKIILFITGAVLTLSLAPFKLYPLAFISIAYFYYQLNHRLNTRKFLTSFIFALGFYLTSISWVYISMQSFGQIPSPIAAILTFLFCCLNAIFFMLPTWLYQKLKSPSWLINPLCFATCFTLLEWLKTIPPIAFPWALLGYSLTESPFASLASYFGVLGLSWLIWLIGASIGQGALLYKQGTSIQEVIKTYCCILLPIGLLGLSSHYLLSQTNQTQISDNEAISTYIIQGNIPQEKKWDRLYAPKIIDTYMQLTDQIDEQDALIVWPEAALPFTQQQLKPLITALEQRLESKRQGFITGVLNNPENKVYYNSLIALGQTQGNYQKQILVPFGEYIPLKNFITAIGLNPLGLQNITQGNPLQKSFTQGKHSIYGNICYEIIFGHFIAKNSQDSEIILTVSNDAWFENSIALSQHLQMAQMRAIENQKPIIRATNTGISAFINAKGQVTASLAEHKQGIINQSIKGRTGTTFYSKWRQIPILTLCLLILSLCMLYHTKIKRQNTQP